MLTITVPGKELWDEKAQEFYYTESAVLDLEHSLASLSKWEELFKKPFLTSDTRSDEEAIGYIKAMTLTPNVSGEVYERLSEENFSAIAAYMNDSRTATWFNDTPGGSRNSQTLTSELIYYWMYSAGIDKAHEHDHLSRLLTLLRVFGAQNGPKKKVPEREAASERARLNAERKKLYETSG